MTGYAYELGGGGGWAQVGAYRKGSFLVHSGTRVNVDEITENLDALIRRLVLIVDSG